MQNKNETNSNLSVFVNRKLVTEKYLDAVRKKKQGDPEAEGIQKQLLVLLLKGIEKGEVDLTEMHIYETK